MTQLSLKDHIKAHPFPLKAIVSGGLFKGQRERMKERGRMNFCDLYLINCSYLTMELTLLSFPETLSLVPHAL